MGQGKEKGMFVFGASTGPLKDTRLGQSIFSFSNVARSEARPETTGKERESKALSFNNHGESREVALFYRGKIIPIGDETIEWIRQDPMKIWGWFDLELMLAWKNMFPLMKESKELGYLPLMNKTWELTSNSW